MKHRTNNFDVAIINSTSIKCKSSLTGVTEVDGSRWYKWKS